MRSRALDERIGDYAAIDIWTEMIWLGPSFTNVYLNASMTFPVFERMNLQLRAELFNLPNHTNYSTPDNGVQDAQFRQILSATRPGREYSSRLSWFSDVF